MGFASDTAVQPTGDGRYTTEIIAEEMQLLGSREGGGEVEFGSGGGAKGSAGGAGGGTVAKGGATTKPAADDLDDDIPF